MLGKTFKGLTDAMLAWQTERLLALEVARDDWTVHVRPELVVEIAFDGVQTSPRYPGGVALRFARVLRHRPDKAAAEADTLDAVLAVHAGRLVRASEALQASKAAGGARRVSSSSGVCALGVQRVRNSLGDARAWSLDDRSDRPGPGGRCCATTREVRTDSAPGTACAQESAGAPTAAHPFPR